MKPEELEDEHIVNVLNALSRTDVEWARGVPDCYRGHLREAAVRLMRYKGAVPMTAMQKAWLANLLDGEIAQERAAVQNESLWAFGAPNADSRRLHEANVEEHAGYADVLEKIRARYVGEADGA